MRKPFPIIVASRLEYSYTVSLQEQSIPFNRTLIIEFIFLQSTQAKTKRKQKV